MFCLAHVDSHLSNTGQMQFIYLSGSVSDTLAINRIQSGSEVWPHFFVLSRILKLHNINLIQLYAWVAEIEYYMYTLVQIEKPLNMKHNKKNKLQYFEKNYIKKDKMIIKMFGRLFCFVVGVCLYNFTSFIELSTAHLLKKKSRFYHFP